MTMKKASVGRCLQWESIPFRDHGTGLEMKMRRITTVRMFDGLSEFILHLKVQYVRAIDGDRVLLTRGHHICGLP